MAQKITRKEARDILFGLLFEIEFHTGDDPATIYELACLDRDIPADKYIRESFFGIISKNEVLDTVISKYAKGWRADRLSRVSRTVIRIAVYEILFAEDIPANVSISQAVELTLKYGEDKAKQFVNGVLSGLYKDVESRGIDSIIADAVAALSANTEKALEEADAVEIPESGAENGEEDNV